MNINYINRNVNGSVFYLLIRKQSRNVGSIEIDFKGEFFSIHPDETVGTLKLNGMTCFMIINVILLLVLLICLNQNLIMVFERWNSLVEKNKKWEERHDKRNHHGRN